MSDTLFESLFHPLSYTVARFTALRPQITVMRILKIFAKNSSSSDAKGHSTTDPLSWDFDLASASCSSQVVALKEAVVCLHS